MPWKVLCNRHVEIIFFSFSFPCSVTTNFELGPALRSSGPPTSEKVGVHRSVVAWGFSGELSHPMECS